MQTRAPLIVFLLQYFCFQVYFQYSLVSWLLLSLHCSLC